MTKGARVAKPGKQANFNRPQDILFTSEQLSPKVYKSDGGTVTTDSTGSASFVIEHDLSYSPAYLVYINPCQALVNNSYSMPSSWGLVDNNFTYVTSKKNGLRVDLQDSGTNITYKYFYFIFVEAAKDE
jgi:hypothetical protein